MSELLHRLTGVYKSVLEVYEDKVIIKKKGAAHFFMQGNLKGDKTIYIKDITTVEYKPVGKFTMGYMQFTVAGAREWNGGVDEAMKDENAIAFNDAKKNDVAEKIKATIDRIKSEQSGGTVVQQASGADELRKYKQLADDGVITQDEFEAKKRQLLGI